MRFPERSRALGCIALCVVSLLVRAGAAVADTTPPGTPTVTDDGPYTTDTTQLHATWSSSDPDTGIAEYRYQIRRDAPTGGVVKTWVTAGLATQATATGFRCGLGKGVVVDGLCQGKAYFFEVQARNGASLWSASGFSNGIIPDGTPPAPVTVTDDGAFTADSTQLHAVWTAATDPHSGIAGYEYAIFLGPPANDLRYQDWTSVGLATSVTATGLDLTIDQTYYIGVRATNGAGLVSAAGYSDGITVGAGDDTPPTAPGQPTEGTPDQDFDADGAYTLSWLPADDPQSGVAAYELCERVGLSGPCTVLSSTVASTSFPVTGRPNGQTYFYQVRARNGSGVWGPASAFSDGVTIDTQAPQLSPVGVTNITGNGALLNWTTNEPTVCRADYGTTTQYGQSTPANSTPQTAYSVPLSGLAAGTLYHVRARCADQAGNPAQSADHTFTTAIPPLGANPSDVEGMIFASWWYNEYEQPTADESMARLAATGADYVGVLATEYMNSYTANVIAPHPQKTPTEPALRHAIQRAKALGRKVFLKLHVRVILNDAPFGNWQDDWAGQIQPATPSAWFTSYRSFAAKYAQLAQQEGVELFAFGTEMLSMTTPQFETQWLQVIDAVEAVYTGQLTYSANQPVEFLQIPASFWSRCDYLGIGPYYSLTPASPPSPSLDAIVDGWRASLEGGDLIQVFSTWSADHGNKPVLFTELGYNSVDTATYQPWKGTQNWPENQALQRRAYDALFLTLQGQPWFAGVFWWDWLTHPEAGTEGLERRDYTPQNKLAQASLEHFFLGVDTTAMSALRIVDGEGVEVPDGTLVSAGDSKNLYAVGFNGTLSLGFVPATWNLAGTAAGLAANTVGAARLTGNAAGNVQVTATLNGRSDAVTLSIGASGLRVPSQYPTIQAAANAAQSGGTIFVAPGTYAESITLPAGVKLISEQGAAVTIIDATGKSFGIKGGQRVEGFTIRNASGAGIARPANFANTTKEIVHNIIRNNAPGIDIYAGGQVLIANNLILSNATTEYGGGIRLDGGVAATVVNNVIANNTAADGGGVYVSGSSGSAVLNNIIVGNAGQYGAGIRVWTGGSCAPPPLVDFNDVWNNSGGQQIYMCGPPPGNISVDPQFVNSSGGDYHLQAGSPCRNAGHPDSQYNDPDGSRNDMGAYGGPNGGW